MLQVAHLDYEINLDGNVLLRRIPSDRLGEMQQELRTEYGDAGIWLAQYEVFREFECDAPAPEDFNDLVKEIELQFQEILAALRLFRLGKVDFTGFIVKPVNYDNRRVNFRGVFFNPRSHIGALPEYRLHRADAPQIERLLALIRRSKLVRQFFFQRFMRSYHEKAIDRIVDCTICLESLLAGGNAPEVKYRFRLRGAAILSPNAAQQQKYFDLLGAIYDLRSSVVHGTFCENSRESKKILAAMGVANLWEASRECLELARKLILISLEEPELFRSERLFDIFELGRRSSSVI